jgi:hypothetical protein
VRRLAPLVLVVALAGCESLLPGPKDAEGLARDYLGAVQARDWAAVCATRTRLERHQLEQRRGSCEKAIREILEPQVAGLRDARPGAVRVHGEEADIDVLGADGARLTVLRAIIDEGDWKLQSPSTRPAS